MDTPKEVKEAMAKALESFDALDNHELVVTTDLMDVIEPGTTYKGLYVVLGKDVTVRERKTAQVKPTVDPRSFNGTLLYFFRGKDGKPFMTDKRKAWRYITQNGQWKYTPQYLGAVPEKTYKDAFAPVQKKIDETAERLRELTMINNQESERMPPQQKKEMRDIMEKDRKLTEAFMAEFVSQCDPSIRPDGSDLVQVIARTDGTVRGNPEQIVRGTLGM